MMILCNFGSFRPFWRAQAWAVEHLLSIHSASGDFRWSIAALVLRSFAALEVFAHRQLACLARTVLEHAWRGARFAADLADADSMVAAGGG